MGRDFRLKIWEKEVQRWGPGYEGLLSPGQMDRESKRGS